MQAITQNFMIQRFVFDKFIQCSCECFNLQFPI